MLLRLSWFDSHYNESDFTDHRLWFCTSLRKLNASGGLFCWSAWDLERDQPFLTLAALWPYEKISHCNLKPTRAHIQQIHDLIYPAQSHDQIYRVKCIHTWALETASNNSRSTSTFTLKFSFAFEMTRRIRNKSAPMQHAWLFMWQHFILFKSLGSVSVYFKLFDTLIQEGCIKLIKSESKDSYNATKYFYFK